MKIFDAIDKKIALEIDAELLRTTRINGHFHSAHEGFAVIFEEVYELWKEIIKKQTERDRVLMRKEAIQIAAMSVRFIQDLLEEP